MNKSIFLTLVLSLFVLNGCEPELSGVIDSDNQYFRIKSLSSIHSYNYNPLDSFLTISVEFSDFNQVSSVYSEIFGPDKKKINNEKLFLFDNGNINNADQISGDGKFSNKIPFNDELLNGNYLIEYYASDIANKFNKIGQEIFSYNNGKTNIPPIIFNLTAPYTITLNSSFVFAFFSIEVSDSNGLGDIKDVYIQSYRPDGTTSGITTSLYDDGGQVITPSSGDQIAGDGIYSLIVSLPHTTTKGLWRFVFRAIDRGNKVSNEISHNILVQ